MFNRNHVYFILRIFSFMFVVYIGIVILWVILEITADCVTFCLKRREKLKSKKQQDSKPPSYEDVMNQSEVEPPTYAEALIMIESNSPEVV